MGRGIFLFIVLLFFGSAKAQYKTSEFDSASSAANSHLVQGKDTIWIKAQGGGTPTWDAVLNKPATFPPDAHTQSWSTITNQPVIPIAQAPDSSFAKTVWWIQPNLGTLTTIANVGFATAPTVRGTATSYNDTLGKFLNYASAAVVDSPAGWRTNVYNEFLHRQSPEITFCIKTGPNATDTNKCVYWIGLLGGNYKRLDDSATWNIAAFRYSTNADSLLRTWQAVTKAAGAAGVITVTNTGVGIAPMKQYIMSIKIFANSAYTAIDSVQFSINGSRVACSTTNLPALGTALGYYAMVTSKTSMTTNIRIKKIYGVQK